MITAKTSKWTTIQGSCVVPAHGYKVVWCDKDGVCPDSGFASDEAYVRFNVTTDSDSGKVLFLANTDGEIFNRLPLPGGIKDISYGLGHLSRTVVSATSDAQYKVGEGEWKPVAGPAGMSTVAGGFRTVEYKVNKQVSNMDVAEACLADPSTWTYAPATNTVQSIAFGSGGNVVILAANVAIVNNKPILRHQPLHDHCLNLAAGSGKRRHLHRNGLLGLK